MKTISVILIAALTMLARAEDKLFDDELAKNAVAVLRIHKFTEATPFPKLSLTRQEVHVYEVYKNESSENFNHDIAVWAYIDRDGVPSGECTVYLERYEPAKKMFNKKTGLWVLVGGDATNGVSHIDRDARYR
jgi:hypothetical protein